MQLLNKNPNVKENVELTNVKLGNYTEIKAFSIIEDSQIGDYSYCSGYNQINYTKIGKFCSIASFVRINPGNHPLYTRVAQHHFTYRSEMFGFGEDDKEFFKWREKSLVTIGNDVWIGHNATIMPGVTIGNGAVIGTGSIVTHDIPAYSVAVGSPAKVIKMRFPQDIINKLQALCWWDWNYDKIKQSLNDFRNLDIFIKKYLN